MAVARPTFIGVHELIAHSVTLEQQWYAKSVVAFLPRTFMRVGSTHVVVANSDPEASKRHRVEGSIHAPSSG